MTIREQLTRDIENLWRRVTELSDDPDIITVLRPQLYRVGDKLEQCMAILKPEVDAGPTQADIAGEVVHVPAPF
jgi:hypothetical protein